MLVKMSVILGVVGNLILYHVNYSECEPNCGVLTKSTCTDDITTQWNKISVGENLRKWIISLRKIEPISEKEKEKINLRKSLVLFERKNNNGSVTGSGIYFVSNGDCSTKRNIGPRWRKAHYFSKTQFHDGFLYNNEDKNGNFTGLL